MRFAEIRSILNNSRVQIANQAVYQVFSEILDHLTTFDVSELNLGKIQTSLLPNPIIEDLLIQKGNPEYRLKVGETDKLGRFQAYDNSNSGISQNLHRIGTDGYLDNTAFSGWLAHCVDSGTADGFYIQRASAGANPRTPVNMMTIDNAGTLSAFVFSVFGGQIVFPATQNPSSNANTLDDYEEGTWTPSITGDGGGSGQTYSFQDGRYIKIGQLVQATGRIVLTAAGTITGNVIVAGLPFTVLNVTGINHVGVVSWFNLATNWVQIEALLASSGTTTFFLRGANAAAANSVTNLVQADIANNSGFGFTITYRAAS